MKINNKTVFITGATTGIGLETAKLLLEERANVVIYSISIPKNPEINTLKKQKNILIIKGDIRNKKSVKSALKKTTKKFGKIDVLINNASIAQRKDFEKTTQKDWDAMIDINIKGTLNVTQIILKQMLRPQIQSPMIINISSGAGYEGIEHLSLYSLTKSAIMNFTHSLSDELSNKKIDILTVAPGSTDTQMFKEVFPGQKPHHTPKQVAQVIIKTIKKEILPDERRIIDVFHHAK